MLQLDKKGLEETMELTAVTCNKCGNVYTKVRLDNSDWIGSCTCTRGVPKDQANKESVTNNQDSNN